MQSLIVYLFSLEDVPKVFQAQTLQELVDGHVQQSCRVIRGGYS